jgi:hypothetical protein
MKVVLIQTWLGPIPDYFWYHYETTKNLNIDFLFVTDQDIVLDSKNYKVVKTTKEEIEGQLSQILNTNFVIKNNKKSCDLKASFGHLFEKHINEYDYFGCYDIDTFFGDFEKYITEHLGNYDFISIGDEKIHNRLSGPFLLIRNIKELRELYIGPEFIKCFDNENVECFEEHVLSDLAKEKYIIKLLDSSNSNTEKDGKNEYNGMWSGGKVFVNNTEKFQYHFYRKNHTKIQKVGNTITAKYNKKYIDDFLWVVHFSEKYETLLPYLIDSIKKYSNRKCLFYSINYTPSFLFKNQFESEQFIFRRIDMEPGPLDGRGRDSRIMNSKPLILMDAIKSFPNKKFVHIDTDIYLTTNADDITKYFNRLENYPLMNSHIHDVMFISGIRPDEEWTSPLHVLLDAMGEKNEPIFTRRKCNIILFDERSYWFFEEQMELYNKFKDSGIPGILAIFDEDTANALLAKYQFKNSLPLIDIEESYNLDIEKIHNYSYNMTGTSIAVELPKTINDFLFFHGFKYPNDYEKIQKEYGKSTLENEEMVITYGNNTILFEKNSFIHNKKIDWFVDFVILDLNGIELHRLRGQEIFNYWVFYISDLQLKGQYIIKIMETTTNKCIFNDIIEVK